jgi:hypothetical protein
MTDDQGFIVATSPGSARPPMRIAALRLVPEWSLVAEDRPEPPDVDLGHELLDQGVGVLDEPGHDLLGLAASERVRRPDSLEQIGRRDRKLGDDGLE